MENSIEKTVQLPALVDYSFNEFVEQVKKGQEIILSIKPTDPQTQAKALELLGKAKTLRLMVEKKVEELTRPAKDTKKAIDEWQRRIKDRAEEVVRPLNIAAEALNQAVVAYDNKVREEAAITARLHQRQAELRELGLESLADQILTISAMSDTGYNKIVRDARVKIEADKQAKIDELKKQFEAAKATEPNVEAVPDYVFARKTTLIEMGFVDTGRGFQKGETDIAPIVITNYNEQQWGALLERILIDETKQKQEAAMLVVTAPEKPKGMTTIWKYEIVDENAIPREYCIPSPGKLTDAVRLGVREIPGVRIYQESKIR